MSIPKIYTDVLAALMQKSLAKEVLWSTTTDADAFIVRFETSGIVLRQYTSRSESWIDFDVFNDDGVKIDGFGVSDEEGEDWKTINELFSIARRSALAVDDTIQGILAELNKKGNTE